MCIIQGYAPKANNSVEDLAYFYDQLNEAKTQCKSQEILTIMGDFNTKVGKRSYEDIVGYKQLGERNGKKDKLVEWCTENNQLTANTWLQHHA